MPCFLRGWHSARRQLACPSRRSAGEWPASPSQPHRRRRSTPRPRAPPWAFPLRKALPAHHEALLRHLREELLVEVPSPGRGCTESGRSADPPSSRRGVPSGLRNVRLRSASSAAQTVPCRGSPGRTKWPISQDSRPGPQPYPGRGQRPHRDRAAVRDHRTRRSRAEHCNRARSRILGRPSCGSLLGEALALLGYDLGEVHADVEIAVLVAVTRVALLQPAQDVLRFRRARLVADALLECG